MSHASWQRSNPFTRLTAVAAICNRAQFSYDDGSEKKEVAVEVAPAATGWRARPLPPGAKQSTMTSHPAAATSSYPPGVPMKGALADQRKILGDASEAALLRYCDSLIPIFEYRTAYPTVLEVS